MPDSLLPPGWGFAPFDERDLDAVLSGKTADVPVALRPVADVLASLRAGPVPAELYGEANAMAEFRALGLGQAGRPAPTMLLEALPAGSRARSGRRPARHRVRPARRHPLRRAILRPAALFGAVAAAVIVVAVLVTGNFVGPLPGYRAHGQPVGAYLVRDGFHGALRGAAGGDDIGRPGTDGQPVGSPLDRVGAVRPARPAGLITNLVHPQGPSAWATRPILLQQLTKLARTDNLAQVYQYCARYVQDPFPAETPGAGPDQAPVHPGPGNQDNGDLGQQAGAPANSRNGSGSGPVSSGQASTGQASNGQGDPPGSGSNP